MENNRADQFLYVDVETGGLHPRQHPLLEVTYAVGNENPHTFYPDLYPGWYEDTDPAALAVNGWFDRFPEIRREDGSINEHAGPNYVNETLNLAPWTGSALDTGQWEKFLIAARGKTLVGLNVNFDAEFLTNNQDLWDADKTPWKHRLLNLGPWFSGLVMGAGELSMLNLDTDVPLSGSKIHEVVQAMHDMDGRSPGSVPVGDHTSYQDVIATRYYHQYAYYFINGGVAPEIPDFN